KIARKATPCGTLWGGYIHNGSSSIELLRARLGGCRCYVAHHGSPPEPPSQEAGAELEVLRLLVAAEGSGLRRLIRDFRVLLIQCFLTLEHGQQQAVLFRLARAVAQQLWRWCCTHNPRLILQGGRRDRTGQLQQQVSQIKRRVHRKRIRIIMWPYLFQQPKRALQVWLIVIKVAMMAIRMLISRATSW
ncbi:hypothetical protein CYMTET_39425, partial [Cymbomonas tetramitiformis]